MLATGSGRISSRCVKETNGFGSPLRHHCMMGAYKARADLSSRMKGDDDGVSDVIRPRDGDEVGNRK